MSLPHLSTDILREYTTLSEWVANEESSTTRSASEIKQHIETELIRQATYFALLQYFHHEQTNTWGEVGEDASRLSFTRIILDIPEGDPVTYEHSLAFQDVLKARFNEFDVTAVPIDQIKDTLKNYKFHLAGLEFQLQESEQLNRLLEFIESSLKIQAGDYGHERELILGHGQHISFDEYQVIDIYTEVMRTANMVTSLAAAIGHNQIFVRHVALEGIFQLKWVSFITHPQPSYYQPEYRAGYQLKALTCSAYEINSYATLRDRQNEFLNDMRENILFHELGHGVIQHRLLPIPIATFSEASKIISHPLIHSLLELLAEIAPQNGALFGPLWNIVSVNKTNSKRAERMFWMYVSDTWFFDTGDDYMYFYSDLVAMTFGTALQKDGTFNIQELETRVWKPNGILDLAVGTVVRLCEAIIQRLNRLTFLIDDRKLSFEDAKSKIRSNLVDATTDTIDEYLLQTAEWHQLLDLALQDKEIADNIVSMLEGESIVFLKALAEVAGLNREHPRQDVINRLLNI